MDKRCAKRKKEKKKSKEKINVKQQEIKELVAAKSIYLQDLKYNVYKTDRNIFLLVPPA